MARKTEREDDRELWRRVKASATPLPRRDLQRLLNPQKKTSKPKPSSKKTNPLPTKPFEPNAGRKKSPQAELALGKIENLDRSTGDRLRKGKMPIEGRIDMHGMTQDEALEKLTRFLETSSFQGKRCVIVVHGKGRVSHGGGVLRRMVPLWMNLPQIRTIVLSFTPAQPRDGGGGAMYVYLKRRR